MDCSLILSIRIEFALTISLQSSHTSLMISFVMHQRYLLGKLFVFVHIPRVCVFNSLALVRTSSSPWLRLFFWYWHISLLRACRRDYLWLSDYEGRRQPAAVVRAVAVPLARRVHDAHVVRVARGRRAKPPVMWGPGCVRFYSNRVRWDWWFFELWTNFVEIPRSSIIVGFCREEYFTCRW